MGLRCSYGSCKSRIKNLKCKVKGADGVFFIKFPSPKNDVKKWRNWISACGRDDLTLEKINKTSYICSRHFYGFQGPTPEHPDPIPINAITPQSEIYNHNTPNFEVASQTPKILRSVCPRQLSYSSAFLGIEGNSERPDPIRIGATPQNQIYNNNTTGFGLATETPKVLKSVCPRQLSYSILPSKVDFNNLRVPKGWALEIDEEFFTFFKLQKNCKVIEVMISSEVSVKVLDKNIDPEKIFPNFVIKSADDITIFLSKLDEFSVCPGNVESDLVAVFKQSRRASAGKGHLYMKLDSVYSKSCLGLFKKSSNTPRCQKCSLYRSTLRGMKAQSLKRLKKPKPSSIKSEKAKRVVLNSKEMLSKLKRNRNAIEKMIQICKRQLNTEEPGSFLSVFLDQQIKAMNTSKYGIKWDPQFLKWCCYLKNKSKSTYEALRKSCCMHLPTTRTLYKHMHTTTNSSGFHGEVFKQMSDETGVSNLPEHQKYFMIMLDEMKVKENLVCHKDTGLLTGFTNLTKEHNELDEIEREITGKHTPPLATQVLQLMLRGITSDIRILFAHFPSKTASGAVLYSIIWEAIRRCENAGFRILGVVADGATSNRKFFRMCFPSDTGDSGIPYYTDNLYATDEERQLFFISEAPHLIKTCRNCFSNSCQNSKCRKLWKNGEEILWNVIMRLYYRKVRAKGEFKHLPKLTYSHVFLQSYSRMRVCLAVQVLSESVASAIEVLFAKDMHRYTETVKFIRTFNRFFDLCNVKNLSEANRTLNQDKKPYTSIDDERLTWLEGDFIAYLDEWERDVRDRPGDFSKSERDNMMLSRETIEGLKITAYSTVKIVRFLLNKGAPYVLTQHLNQDLLEQSFGRHRSACGRNTNPSVWLYEANIDKLKSLKGFILEAVGGNTKIT